MQQTTDKQPTDILDRFIFEQTEYYVETRWNNEGFPLFKAADIGHILGLTNVRKTIQNYDADEKEMVTVSTTSGEQTVVFLTDLGVYRILFNSRKPIAVPFQKWVAHAVREIQKKNKKEYDTLLQTVEEYAKRAKQSDHNALVLANAGKNVVYFGRIKQINGKTLIKIGATDDIRQRVPQLEKEYGTIMIFHVLECTRNRAFEKDLHKHPTISLFAFKEPCKVEEGKTSNEVFLVTEEEIRQITNIARANVYKYRSCAVEPKTEDIQKLKEGAEQANELLKSTNDKIDALTEIITSQKSEVIPARVKLFEDEPTVKNFTQGRGPKVQRYSKDGKTLLQTYDSVICAFRDKTINCPRRAQLNKAVDGNFVYKKFRWAHLDRNLPDDTFQILEPTVESLEVNKGFVAKLNLQKTKIEGVYANLKQAAAERQFTGCAAISKAVKTGSQSGGFYFQMWFDCSNELKQAYLENNTLPDKLATGNCKCVQRMDQFGVTKIYATIEDVVDEHRISRATLNKAIDCDNVLKGYKWSWVKKDNHNTIKVKPQ